MKFPHPTGLLVKLAAGIAGATMALSPLISAAQDAAYPSKPITLIAPFPAGGVVDTTARMIAEKMQVLLKGTIIVDNRPGAGGTVGAGLAARAKPDGYTLVVGDPATHIYSPAIYSKVPYDPVKSFTPIGQISFGPLVVVVGPKTKANSIAELMADLRAAGDKESYGSNGNGSTPHLATELFKQVSGTHSMHVPYGGGPTNMTALAGGDVAFSINHIPLALGMVKGGKLRALATTGAKRSPTFPDLPTLTESAVKGYEAYSWFALFAPAGLPAAVQEKLSAALQVTLKDPELQRKMSALGDEPMYRNPEELSKYMAAETARWTPIIKSAKVRVD